MRKIVMALVAIIFVLMFVPTVGGSSPPAVELKVAAFDLYPSIYIDEDGNYSGFVVDLLNEIAAKEYWSIKYVYGTWEEGLERVKSGGVDLVTNIVRTKEREAFLNFTEVPLLVVWVEVYANERTDIHDVFDIKGKTVGIMYKDYNAKVFREYASILELDCDYEFYKTQQEVLKAVEIGKVDVGVVNSITGVALSHKYKVTKTSIILNPFPSLLAAAKGVDEDILETIDDYIWEWKHDNDSIYHKKLEEYFRKDLDVANKVPTHISIIILILIIGIVGSIGMILLLNKLVEAKTFELEQTKDRFKNLFEDAPLSYQSLNERGNIIEVNQTWLDIMGYTREETLGKNFSEFLHPDWKNHFYVNFPRFKAVGEVLGVEFEMRKKNGDYIIVAFHGKIAKDKNDNFKQTHCVFRDVTEQKIIEKKLMHSQKMESIGTLAAGISHDFNNILFIMMSTAQLLMMDLPKDDQKYKYLVNIVKAGDRGTNLIRQILSFSRQAAQELTNIDVKPVIKEVIKLTRTTIPKNINIINNIDNTKDYVVLADPTHIHQVALNLITNAYHAVELNDGDIIIDLETVSLNNGAIVGKDLKPGKYIKFTVSDKGHGMDPDIVDKIFDPYFTTKDNGKGTGLGLSVVYGIVKECGGDIKVYSEVNKGTVFNVYLPLVEQEATPTTTPTVADGKLNGSGTILIVDDEQQITLIEKLYFTKHGYKVDDFTSSEEALIAFKLQPYKYDAVITDMAMPKMAGDILAAEILTIRPDIPIIMCSGFSERMNEQTAEEMGISRYLMKPVDVTKLIRITRDLIKKYKDSKARE